MPWWPLWGAQRGRSRLQNADAVAGPRMGAGTAVTGVVSGHAAGLELQPAGERGRRAPLRLMPFPRFHWIWWVVVVLIVFFLLNATHILNIHFGVSA